MRILRAYADAGATGSQHFGNTVESRPEKTARKEKEVPRDTGDKLTLSPEAREMLENDGQTSPSIYANDAIYDQNGNMTRQYESLRRDVRQLASKFVTLPGAGVMSGQLESIGQRLAGLEARV